MSSVEPPLGAANLRGQGGVALLLCTQQGCLGVHVAHATPPQRPEVPLRPAVHHAVEQALGGRGEGLRDEEEWGGGRVGTWMLPVQLDSTEEHVAQR